MGLTRVGWGRVGESQPLCGMQCVSVSAALRPRLLVGGHVWCLMAPSYQNM